MDTSTHITMGFGLAGLAYLDPTVSSNPDLANAVLLGTVLGSNAPDFDYIIKLVKGNGMYTEHHRGLSHSVPALILWSIFVSGVVFILQPSVQYFPLFYWTLIAVILHVCFDMMNAYGTQAGRPFTDRWISFNFIPLFDPMIIGAHFIGFGFWFFGFHPGLTLGIIYFVIFIYIFIRYERFRNNRKYIMDQTKMEGIYTLIPRIWIHKWDVVLETESTYYVGTLTHKELHWIHFIEKHDPFCPYILSSLKDKNVKHFLANSKHTYALFVPEPNGYEVRWIDLRFRDKNNYPYMAVVKLDKDRNILFSFTGWMNRSKKVKKDLISTNKGAIPL
ncbi:metal-dependent hydrolase [Metabacillus sp. HB246100]